MPAGFCACQKPPTSSLSSHSFPLFIFHCTLLLLLLSDFTAFRTREHEKRIIFFFPRWTNKTRSIIHCPEHHNNIWSETFSIEDALRRQQYWKWEGEKMAGEKWGLCHREWSAAIAERYNVKVANVDPSLFSFNQHNIPYRNNRNRWCSHGCRHGCDCGNWGSAQSASARLSSLPYAIEYDATCNDLVDVNCDYAKHTS